MLLEISIAFFGIVGTAGAATTGWFATRVINTASSLKAHEAADTVQFHAIAETLRDLKNGQQNQTDKLDRLVEHFLRP